MASSLDYICEIVRGCFPAAEGITTISSINTITWKVVCRTISDPLVCDITPAAFIAAFGPHATLRITTMVTPYIRGRGQEVEQVMFLSRVDFQALDVQAERHAQL